MMTLAARETTQLSVLLEPSTERAKTVTEELVRFAAYGAALGQKKTWNCVVETWNAPVAAVLRIMEPIRDASLLADGLTIPVVCTRMTANPKAA